MAAGITSASEAKQPLSERATNLPSPFKSPSKIALPPSPITSPVKSEKQVMEASVGQQEASVNSTQRLRDYVQPDLAPPKPALVRKVSEAHSSGQTYISPSDDILSPTSKKLTEVKGRRFASSKKNVLYNASKLFAKANSKANDDTGEGGS
ncbi:hypothetical protein H2198_004172 [Neophaeococcomyces mojaviensis]|uniref:Uncharacterized protein n=1 Tax=Neophaeococcomyces mojaviensis TaxID=3383035 RepID=A0ACC3A9Q1_9EURO|nr:hypothetical protein H2198_004172 [Knufia sp. JES_112]